MIQNARSRIPPFTRGVALWVGLLSTTPVGGAECDLEGLVRSRAGAPIAGARVSVVGSGSTTDVVTRTDEMGRFCLAAPSGNQDLLVVAEGFMVGGGLVDVPSQALEIHLEPSFAEAMVVTATGSARAVGELPLSVSQLDREALTTSGARTLADAIEWAPGVRVESTCSNCNQPSLALLGLGSAYTQVLIDGRATLSSLALVYGLEQLPARMIESVEVVKGGGSALYGSGAVAGVVNLLTRRPTRNLSSLGASGSLAGGERAGRVGISSERLGARWGLLASFQHDQLPAIDLDDDAFSDVSRRRLNAFGLGLESRDESAGRREGGRWVLDVALSRENRRGGDQLELPPHLAEIAEAIDTTRTTGSLAWLDSSASTATRASLAGALTRRDSYYGTGRDPLAYGETASDLVALELQHDRLGLEHTVTFALQGRFEDLDDSQPGYGREIAERYHQVGLAAQDDWRPRPELTVLAGARVDQLSSLSDVVLSPRVAVLWQGSDEVALRLSLAEGFRAPEVFDEDLHLELVGDGLARIVRPSPDLEPERSRNLTVGLEWRPHLVGQAAVVALTGFGTRLEDLFATEVTSATADRVELLKVNRGSAEVSGLELAAAWLRPGIQVETAWVVQRGRLSEAEPEFGASEPMRTPDWHGSLRVSFELGPWGASLGLLATGPMLVPHYAGFIADDRLERTPATASLDLVVSRRFDTPLEARLELRVGNATDERQRDLDPGPRRDPSYVYGPRSPRSYGLGVELSW